jgi:hypothetical protein
MNKKPFLVDVSVAVVFFVRPDTLKPVFEKIKIARPSKLFLIQDGPRKNNESDMIKINECRCIVEDIDWECHVFTNYSNENLGIGARSITGFQWLFNLTEMAIILEDDCVADPSFFPFCAELLEKYKNDERINMISGFNHLGKHANLLGSYFFAKSGPSIGWATWRRCWSALDLNLEIIESKVYSDLLREAIKTKREADYIISNITRTKEKINKGEKAGNWTAQWGLVKNIQSQVVIISSVNLISNIGVGNDSTYSGNNYNLLPKRLKKIFFSESYVMNFPLIHPKYIICDYKYDYEVHKMISPQKTRWFVEKIAYIFKKALYYNKGGRKS